MAVTALYTPAPVRPPIWRKKITRLLLVRHAVPAGLAGGTGPALSPRGVDQAASLGERLAGLPVTALYTSPLERARETAAALSARIGLPAEAVAALDDHAAGGLPRGREAMEWLLAPRPNADALVVAVTHLPIIRLALCHMLGLEAGHQGRFRVEHCGITEMIAAGAATVIVSVNDTSHLKSLDG